ncbi:Uncharacterised protein [Legionella pneumophila]|nr:Uncharacterised protein [Legionella pneumophila]
MDEIDEFKKKLEEYKKQVMEARAPNDLNLRS